MHPRKPAVSFIDPETEEELTLSSGCWVQRASILYAVYVLCNMKVLHICASLSHLLLGILSAIQQKKGGDYMIREQSLSGAIYRGLSIIQMSP